MAKLRSLVQRRKAVRNIRKITRTMELIATARFKKALDRGYRMVELLKQPQFKPMDVIDQIMVIFAGTKGYVDKVPLPQVAAWEQQFLTFMREQAADVRNALIRERKLNPALEQQLKAAIERFQPQFRPPSNGKA